MANLIFFYLLSNILKNNLFASIVLILVVSLLTFFLKANPEPNVISGRNEGILYQLISGNQSGKVIQYSLIFLTIAATTFLLHQYLSKSETLSKPTFFSSLVYVLLVADFLSFSNLHPGIVCNFFIILGVHKIVQAYRLNDAKTSLFDGAFFLSAGTLFYWPALLLLPLVFISIAIIRPFIWREWAVALIGIMVPPALLLSALYIFDYSVVPFRNSFNLSIDTGAYHPYLTSQYFLLLTIVLFMGLIALRRISKGSFSRKIRQQKNISILSAWLILGGLAMFFDHPYSYGLPVLAIPPLSALLGEWMGSLKKNYQSDMALLLLITSVTLIVFQF